MRSRFFGIYLLYFVNNVGFSIIFPILPFILKSQGATEVEYGVLSAIFPLCALFSSPVLGSLSDQIGRKPVLIISYIGTFIGWIVFGLAYFLPSAPIYGHWTLPLLAIALARAIDGITAGNTAVANAYLADITQSEERSKMFGTLGAISGISVLIAPSIGSFIASGPWGFFGVAVFASLLSFMTIIWMTLYLKESLTGALRKPATSILSKLNVFSKLASITKHPHLYPIFLSRGVLGLLFGIYGTIIGLIVIDRFGFTEKNFGYFMMFVGTYLIFNQYVMSKKFISRFGDMKTFLIGHGIAMIGYVLITFTFNLPLYFAFYYVLNLGFSLIFPTISSLLSKGSGDQQGEVMGISEALNSIGAVIGPLVGGYLLAQFGYVTLLIVIPLLGLSMWSGSRFRDAK